MTNHSFRFSNNIYTKVWQWLLKLTADFSKGLTDQTCWKGYGHSTQCKALQSQCLLTRQTEYKCTTASCAKNSSRWLTCCERRGERQVGLYLCHPTAHRCSWGTAAIPGVWERKGAIYLHCQPFDFLELSRKLRREGWLHASCTGIRRQPVPPANHPHALPSIPRLSTQVSTVQQFHNALEYCGSHPLNAGGNIRVDFDRKCYTKVVMTYFTIRWPAKV